MFGATEETDGNLTANAGPPSTTYSWYRNGTEADVRCVFKNELKINGVLYHSANYYTEYRCTRTNYSFLEDARNMVGIVSTSGYNALDNNCLTKALQVFRAYDPTSLAFSKDGVATPPTVYYDSLNWGVSYALADTTGCPS
jgi:hypothetical protein